MFVTRWYKYHTRGCRNGNFAFGEVGVEGGQNQTMLSQKALNLASKKIESSQKILGEAIPNPGHRNEDTAATMGQRYVWTHTHTHTHMARKTGPD